MYFSRVYGFEVLLRSTSVKSERMAKIALNPLDEFAGAKMACSSFGLKPDFARSGWL
jgi:hypothetical protein